MIFHENRLVCWQTILMKYHTLFFSKFSGRCSKICSLLQSWIALWGLKAIPGEDFSNIAASFKLELRPGQGHSGQKWYVTLHDPKMHPHTKLGIPTSNNTMYRQWICSWQDVIGHSGPTDSVITICLPLGAIKQIRLDISCES